MTVRIFAALFIFAFAGVFYTQYDYGYWALGAFGVGTLAVCFIDSLRPLMAFFVAVFATHLSLVSVRAVPYLKLWPINLIVIAGITYLAIRYIMKAPLQEVRWNYRFSKKEWLSVFIITLPSILILYWYFVNHPEVSDQFPLPDLPMWSLPFVVLALAAVNGLREELIYRYLYLSLPNKTEIDLRWVLLLGQAVLFGFLHFQSGFPQGWLGVLMTGTWGLAIGIQFTMFRSITLAWFTHSVADAIMFTIILATRP